jgi:hypothetical protein
VPVYEFDDHPNGCFVLDRIADAKTYAGIIALGMTTWSELSDQLKIPLYKSDDAWHTILVRLTRDGFEGTGNSAGVGAAEPGYEPDLVVGRRIGSANLGQCVTGAWERKR